MVKAGNAATNSGERLAFIVGAVADLRAGLGL